jgi:hypothetical protein
VRSNLFFCIPFYCQVLFISVLLQHFHSNFFRLSSAIKSAVSSAVNKEMIRDAKSQHFTKRMQQRTLAKTKQPLAKKIEAKMEDRLSELKKELEQLRAVKVKNLDDESSDEDSDAESSEADEKGTNEDKKVRHAKKDSWYERNIIIIVCLFYHLFPDHS